jgi:hypothetical protein
MSARGVHLSVAAIQNVNIDNSQEDFVTFVGVKTYRFPAVIAQFLSPQVCLRHSVDPSVAEYVVETPDLNGEFDLFLSLGSSSTISATEANLAYGTF